MKLGIFGGSFDPIHSGHIIPVRRAAEVLGLERVFYLPTGATAAQARTPVRAIPAPFCNGGDGSTQRG